MPRKTELQKIEDVAKIVAFHAFASDKNFSQHKERISLSLQDIVIICTSYPEVREKVLELIADTKPKNGE